MHWMLSTLRLGACFAKFMLEMVVLGVPGLRWILVKSWWRGRSLRETRLAVSDWQHSWARPINKDVNRVQRNTLRFDLTPEAEAAIADPERQLHVMSTHQGYSDTPNIYEGLRGRPVVWPGKWYLRWLLPAAGKSAAVMGCSFLPRGSSEKKRRIRRERITEMANIALANGFVLAHYPEGHRFKRKHQTPEFSKVLRPNIGGFDVYTTVMPDATIVHLTLERTPNDQGGNDIVVHGCVRVLPPGLTREQKQDVLMGWWRESDELLSRPR